MKIMKYMFIGALAGTTLTSVTSCTDLDEKLYDKLNDTNIDLTNKNDLSLILGASVAQYRYLVEDWFGMFHLWRSLPISMLCLNVLLWVGVTPM